MEIGECLARLWRGQGKAQQARVLAPLSRISLVFSLKSDCFANSARVHSEELFCKICAFAWERPNGLRFNFKGREPMNKRSAMPNVQTNTGEAILGLCYLMRDLEILASELFVAEEAERRPIGTHQAPLSERLSRIGVDDQKIENFNAWRQTLSDLTGNDSRDDNHLGKIAAAEKSGLIVLAELIEDLRTRDRQTKASKFG